MLIYLRKFSPYDSISFPNCSFYPSLQFQQALPENLQVTQPGSKKVNCRSSPLPPSAVWPAVSSPVLYKTTWRGVPFCYASISKWSCRFSPPASLPIHPVFPALKSSRNSGNLLTKPVREANGPTEQVVGFRSPLSHLFSIFNTPSPIPSSVADLAVATPHSLAPFPVD